MYVCVEHTSYITHYHMLHTLGERRAASLHNPARTASSGACMWPGKPGPRVGFAILPRGWGPRGLGCRRKLRIVKQEIPRVVVAKTWPGHIPTK